MFKQYKRIAIAEMTPYKLSTSLLGVSISEADLKNGSPKNGDMIARNPKDHTDRWLVAEQYYKDNFAEAEGEQPAKSEEGTLAAFKEGVVESMDKTVEGMAEYAKAVSKLESVTEEYDEDELTAWLMVKIKKFEAKIEEITV